MPPRPWPGASWTSKICADGSAVAAEKKLTAQRGIGIWTARYVLMRGGFADAAPVGDSALATALQRLHKLPERPDAGPDRAADGSLRAASQPRHHASVDQPEGGGMTKRYWSTIESPFQTFAAWVDEEGRLLRFNLRATGAAKVDPEAENNARRAGRRAAPGDEYAKGKRRDFEFELGAEGPEFNKQVWKALLDIPFGTTTSYGAIAKTIGHPKRGARRRRRQWRQSHRPDRALPPGDRRRRQPDRLWRRPAAQAQAAGA